MKKICPANGSQVNCTENCRDCAKDFYDDLKEMVGNAELVTEQAIRTELSDEVFEMLRQYNFIEHCRVDELGRHWYAV